MLGRSVLVVAPIVVFLGLNACISDEHVDPSSLVYPDGGSTGADGSADAADGPNSAGRLCRTIIQNPTCPVSVAVNNDDLTCNAGETCCLNEKCVPKGQGCAKGASAQYECFSDNHCSTQTCCTFVTEGTLPPNVCGGQEKVFRLTQGTRCNCPATADAKRLCVDNSDCAATPGDTCQFVRLQIADPNGGPDFVRRAKLCAK